MDKNVEMIIIATVGRCGSSVLTLYFKKLGLSVGKTRWIKELDAGMEDSETCQINHILLRGDAEARRAAAGRIKDLKAKVVKDPQFLIDPKLIRTWAKKRDISVIFLTRNPRDIVQSLKSKPHMNSPVFRNHVDLIIKHEHAFVSACHDLELPFVSLEFPRFAKDFKYLRESLRPLGIYCEKDVFDNVFDINKIHHENIEG